MNRKTIDIIKITSISIIIIGASIGLITNHSNKYSSSERRGLAQLPELSSSNLETGRYMNDFEKFAMDQFPMRDSLRCIKSLAETRLVNKKDIHNIYTVNGYTSKLNYPLVESRIAYKAKEINKVYDECIKDSENVNMYVSVIPDKNYYLTQGTLYPALDYNEIATKFINNLNGISDENYINIYDELNISDYYLTDQHWRQTNIEKVADKLIQSMGIDTDEIEYSTELITDDFYGAYCGQTCMLYKSDKIEVLNNTELNKCSVYYLDGDKEKQGELYRKDKIDSKDKYDVFLDGAQSLVMIINNSSKTNKRLIIFRDSFGSSIAPLLAHYYKEIALVDLRYIKPAVVKNYVTFDNSDILILYSSLILNN